MHKNKFFEIKNISPDKGEIRIYGEITKYPFEKYGEVSSLTFSREVQQLKDVKQIDIKLNSPGGDVFEALAIYNELKRISKDKEVRVLIDGLAASAATIIALAGRKIIMGKGCYFMIHNPAMFLGFATENELEKAKEQLEKIKNSIISLYLEKTSLTKEELIKKMDNETWFNSEEALAVKFADEIADYDSDTVTTNISKVVTNNIKLPTELVELIKNQKDKEEKMTLKELQEKHPEIINEIKNSFLGTDAVRTAVNNAIENERKRIKVLDSISVKSVKGKEIVDKAKFIEPRDYKDVIVDLFNLNSEKAAIEIEQQENEKNQSGINNLTSGTYGTSSEQLEENIVNAALQEMGIVKEGK